MGYGGLRGISPVIATVIIVAVAIAISVAVASWLLGLWGPFAGYEALQVLPDSYVDLAAKQLVLHVRNAGTEAARVYMITVNGEPVAYEATVEPGDSIVLTVPLSQGNSTIVSLEPGAAYTVTVYTEAGGAYTVVVYARG